MAGDVQELVRSCHLRAPKKEIWRWIIHSIRLRDKNFLDWPNIRAEDSMALDRFSIFFWRPTNCASCASPISIYPDCHWCFQSPWSSQDGGPYASNTYRLGGKRTLRSSLSRFGRQRTSTIRTLQILSLKIRQRCLRTNVVSCKTLKKW